MDSGDDIEVIPDDLNQINLDSTQSIAEAFLRFYDIKLKTTLAKVYRDLLEHIHFQDIEEVEEFWSTQIQSTQRQRQLSTISDASFSTLKPRISQDSFTTEDTESDEEWYDALGPEQHIKQEQVGRVEKVRKLEDYNDAMYDWFREFMSVIHWEYLCKFVRQMYEDFIPERERASFAGTLAAQLKIATETYKSEPEIFLSDRESKNREIKIVEETQDKGSGSDVSDLYTNLLPIEDTEEMYAESEDLTEAEVLYEEELTAKEEVAIVEEEGENDEFQIEEQDSTVEDCEEEKILSAQSVLEDENKLIYAIPPPGKSIPLDRHLLGHDNSKIESLKEKEKLISTSEHIDKDDNLVLVVPQPEKSISVDLKISDKRDFSEAGVGLIAMDSGISAEEKTLQGNEKSFSIEEEYHHEENTSKVPFEREVKERETREVIGESQSVRNMQQSRGGSIALPNSTPMLIPGTSFNLPTNSPLNSPRHISYVNPGIYTACVFSGVFPYMAPLPSPNLPPFGIASTVQYSQTSCSNRPYDIRLQPVESLMLLASQAMEAVNWTESSIQEQFKDIQRHPDDCVDAICVTERTVYINCESIPTTPTSVKSSKSVTDFLGCNIATHCSGGEDVILNLMERKYDEVQRGQDSFKEMESKEELPTNVEIQTSVQCAPVPLISKVIDIPELDLSSIRAEDDDDLQNEKMGFEDEDRNQISLCLPYPEMVSCDDGQGDSLEIGSIQEAIRKLCECHTDRDSHPSISQRSARSIPVEEFYGNDLPRGILRKLSPREEALVKARAESYATNSRVARITASKTLSTEMISGTEKPQIGMFRMTVSTEKMESTSKPNYTESTHQDVKNSTRLCRETVPVDFQKVLAVDKQPGKNKTALKCRGGIFRKQSTQSKNESSTGPTQLRSTEKALQPHGSVEISWKERARLTPKEMKQKTEHPPIFKKLPKEMRGTPMPPVYKRPETSKDAIKNRKMPSKMKPSGSLSKTAHRLNTVKISSHLGPSLPSGGVSKISSAGSISKEIFAPKRKIATNWEFCERRDFDRSFKELMTKESQDIKKLEFTQRKGRKREE